MAKKTAEPETMTAREMQMASNKPKKLNRPEAPSVKSLTAKKPESQEDYKKRMGIK